jgi:hypothetical protein
MKNFVLILFCILSFNFAEADIDSFIEVPSECGSYNDWTISPDGLSVYCLGSGPNGGMFKFQMSNGQLSRLYSNPYSNGNGFIAVDQQASNVSIAGACAVDVPYKNGATLISLTSSIVNHVRFEDTRFCLMGRAYLYDNYLVQFSSDQGSPRTLLFVDPSNSTISRQLKISWSTPYALSDTLVGDGDTVAFRLNCSRYVGLCVGYFNLKTGEFSRFDYAFSLRTLGSISLAVSGDRTYVLSYEIDLKDFEVYEFSRNSPIHLRKWRVPQTGSIESGISTYPERIWVKDGQLRIGWRRTYWTNSTSGYFSTKSTHVVSAKNL